MKLESSNDTLTELEGAVLAIIKRAGTMTAYAVKEVFGQSSSHFWSGSAGAVYPLLERLEARGFVVSEDVSKTRRPKREFTVSAKGALALVTWLTDVERAINVGYDPLRTRLQFCELVPSKKLTIFLEQVENQVDLVPPPASANPLVRSLHTYWIEARHSWLIRFKGALKQADE
jgi:DNA-binding PadR family transcriptional regulator